MLQILGQDINYHLIVGYYVCEEIYSRFKRF